MRRITSALFCFVLFSCHLWARGVASDIRILSSSPQHLRIEFAPQDWRVQDIQTVQGVRQQISFNGCAFTGETGAPRMPIKKIVFGVPQKAVVSARLVDASFETMNNVSIAPVPRMILDEIGYRLVFEETPELYRQSVTPQLFVLDDPVMFRNYRVCSLLFYPLQYFPKIKSARKYTRIVVEIEFSNGGVGATSGPFAEYDVVSKLLLNPGQAQAWRTAGRTPLKKTANALVGNNCYKIIIASDGEGGREGLYKLTGSTLREKGIDLTSIDPGTIQIFNNGGRVLSDDVVHAIEDTLMENPILVIDGDDGVFDPDDYILFYGRSLEGVEYSREKKRLEHYINPYSRENVYWLTFNKNRGKRIKMTPPYAYDGLEAQASFRDLVWREQELYNPFSSGTLWLGPELSPVKNTFSYHFKLHHVVAESSAEFRYSLASFSVGDKFSLFANGNFVGQAEQSGYAKNISLGVHTQGASGVLMNGDNSITLSYQTRSNAAAANIDWIEIEYEKRFVAQDDRLLFFGPLQNGETLFHLSGFRSKNIQVFETSDVANVRQLPVEELGNGEARFVDLSDGDEPKRYIAVAGQAYYAIDAPSVSGPIVPSDLKNSRNVDYIIITHDDFMQPAEQLAALYESGVNGDRLAALVVRISDIINEFGWGIPHPNAIRNFLAWMQQNRGVKYVLLLGDGHYDYRHITSKAGNFILPFEIGGRSRSRTRVSDDRYTYTRGRSAGMQMAIGRLPVRSVNEARAVVKKIVKYTRQPEYGDWLKSIAFVADDEYEAGGVEKSWNLIHTRQAETLAEKYTPAAFDVAKIYLINYPYVRTASVSGITKPLASRAILEMLNRGALIVNYIGHANEELWAHERVLTRSRDFSKIRNGRRQALWIAASCEFAQWDVPDKQSFAEDLFCAADRGAVAIIASAREAYPDASHELHKQFFRFLFSDYERTGMTLRLGDALMLAKRSYHNQDDNERYILLGDPAMRLAAPSLRAVIDELTPDSLRALSKTRVRGRIEYLGTLAPDFRGELIAKAMDSRRQYDYQTPDGVVIRSLWKNGNILFRGRSAVKNGRFDFQFVVPKDISYGGADARLSFYFWNDENAGSGYKNNIAVARTGENLVDEEGPQMLVHFGDPNFAPGDYVSMQPVLHLEISDSISGVNTAGDIGHQILLTIDEDYGNSRDMTEYFTYHEGSYTSGAIEYPMTDIPPGEHSLLVKAWDNANNSSIIETEFVVVDTADLQIRNPLTYPNPMTDDCSFRYELSQEAEVSIRIYTVAGRLIKKFEPAQGHVGYNIFPETWDGRDDIGDPVANGVYLYKMSAKSWRGDETLTAETVSKIIMAK